MTAYRKVKVKGRTHSEHKYIWEQANGPVPDGYVVHHKNHVKGDNDLENLELMTFEEHARHHNDKHARIKVCVICEEEYEPAPKHRGRQQTCSWDCRRELLSQQRLTSNGAAKLTWAQGQEIRRRLEAGEMGKVLASEFGVSPPTITRIKHAPERGGDAAA